MGLVDRPLARDISGNRTATSFRGEMDPLICCQPGLAGRTCSRLDRPRHRCDSVGRLCFSQPTVLAKDEDPVNRADLRGRRGTGSQVLRATIRV